jgi:hypothetical protein
MEFAVVGSLLIGRRSLNAGRARKRSRSPFKRHETLALYPLLAPDRPLTRIVGMRSIDYTIFRNHLLLGTRAGPQRTGQRWSSRRTPVPAPGASVLQKLLPVIGDAGSREWS